MDFYTYFFPNEIVAQIVIAVQFLFFFYWIVSLLRQRSRAKTIYSQISDCEEIGDLSALINKRYLQNNETRSETPAMFSPGEAAAKFEDFCKAKGLPENSPLYKHLKAIFFAGFNESQLNVEALIKNTSSLISSRNTALRSFISLFIILGLVGTLFGLASSLSELSTILSNAGQLNDEVLKNGLKTLLGKLSGAFAPSIWGVLFTIIGVFFFTRYLSRRGFPVLQALEHQTLINWVPNLIPTPSQRLLDKLYLSEKQMEKNFAAAEKVAEFANQIGSDTTELGSNIKNANSSLKDLTETAAKLGEFTVSFTHNLDNFAQNFKESVERLSPVTAGLTGLYQKILDDSQKFQENVQQTLADSQAFRGQVQAEFNKQVEQTQLILNSLKFYENAYIENRQSTDEKIQATLSAAEVALRNLSQQNEIFVRELIQTIGVPLREDLKAELVNVTAALNEITSSSTATLKEITADSTATLVSFSNNSATALDGFSKNVGDEIQAVAVRLGQLENPIQKSADFIEATSKGFDSRTQNFLEEIKREFQNQNQQKENENSNLADLNTGINVLVKEINALAEKMEKLNQKDFGRADFQGAKKKTDELPGIVRKSDYQPEPGFFRRLISKFRRGK